MNQSVIEKIRSDFPAIAEFEQRGIVYLDNAATTQKPSVVIDTLGEFFRKGYGNINRSAHPLGEEATAQWENARTVIKQFVSCPDSHELIFTRGATEASNLIAHGLSSTLSKKSSVAVGLHDHHAQFVPWQQLCKGRNASLLVYGVGSDGRVDTESFEDILLQNPSVVCLTSVSHVTGAELPIKELAAKAKICGAIVVVDGSQSGGTRSGKYR